MLASSIKTRLIHLEMVWQEEHAYIAPRRSLAAHKHTHASPSPSRPPTNFRVCKLSVETPAWRGEDKNEHGVKTAEKKGCGKLWLRAFTQESSAALSAPIQSTSRGSRSRSPSLSLLKHAEPIFQKKCKRHTCTSLLSLLIISLPRLSYNAIPKMHTSYLEYTRYTPASRSPSGVLQQPPSTILAAVTRGEGEGRKKIPNVEFSLKATALKK